jgi:hypothetical protein
VSAAPPKRVVNWDEMTGQSVPSAQVRTIPPQSSSTSAEAPDRIAATGNEGDVESGGEVARSTSPMSPVPSVPDPSRGNPTPGEGKQSTTFTVSQRDEVAMRLRNVLHELVELGNALRAKQVVPDPVQLYRCPFCEALGESPEEIAGHIAEEHPIAMPQVPPGAA